MTDLKHSARLTGLMRVSQAAVWAPLLFLTAGALLMVTPVLSSAAFPQPQMPNRDSGVFLYGGQLVLAGGIPYRDIWDHKPPAVFYLDALGLWLGGPDRWGVWLLESAAILATVLLTMRMLDSAFGTLPALLGCGLLLFGLIELLEVENFTELYALPLQVAAVAWYIDADGTAHNIRAALGVGLLLACLMLLKPTLAGMPLTICILVLARWLRAPRDTRALVWLALAGGAAAAVLLLVGAFFAWHGALGDMLDQVVHYNAVYSISTFGNSMRALASGVERLILPVLVAVAGWVAALVALARGRLHNCRQRTLLSVALLALPVEWLLSAIPGREYYHYFIAWLPAIAILGSFALYVLAQRVIFDARHVAGWGVVTLALIACLLVGRTLVQQIRPRIDRRTAVASYIAAATDPCDYVLMWGAQTAVNYVANRRSPTRYTYLYPLLTRGYQSEAMVQGLLADLRTRPPALIVDSSPTEPEIPALEPARRQTTSDPASFFGLIPEFQALFAYISENYTLAGTVGPGAWRAYKSNIISAARSC